MIRHGAIALWTFTLLLATTALAQQPGPAIVIRVFPTLATPGILNPVAIGYHNTTATDISGATITVRVPGAPGFGPLPENCTSSGDTATCSVGVIPARPANGQPLFQTITVAPILPLQAEATFPLQVTIRPHDPGIASAFLQVVLVTGRAFFVTNTDDSGPGSFRDAVGAASAVCRDDLRCQIVFRIESPEPVKTIRLLSPLPPVIATRILFDATTQTGFGGDTNPLGPEVELNGSALSAGDGLDLRLDCSAEVRGFVINGFPGYGLALRNPDCNRGDLARVVHENYIGTDATGTRAVPNGRGILVDVPSRAFDHQNSPWRIMNNVISGNLRSGIWVENSWIMTITGNTIGLNATRTAGLGNGASGIFINAEGFGTDITTNFIGFNAHAGVSIDARAQYTTVRGNSIQANGQGGIDIGLDGPSSNTRVPPPVIHSAQYDPGANLTIIRGITTATLWFGSTVYLHANDAPDPGGRGEGQYVLGSVSVRSPPGNFEMRVPGDWRGKWVSAVAMESAYMGFLTASGLNIEGYNYNTTSEFGNAVEVE